MMNVARVFNGGGEVTPRGGTHRVNGRELFRVSDDEWRFHNQLEQACQLK